MYTPCMHGSKQGESPTVADDRSARAARERVFPIVVITLLSSRANHNDFRNTLQRFTQSVNAGSGTASSLLDVVLFL